MKPYYKYNGFFYKLEKFSNWIDNEIYRFRNLMEISKKIDYYKRLRYKLSLENHRTELAKKINTVEIWNCDYAIYRLTCLYSEEKYDWMKDK